MQNHKRNWTLNRKTVLRGAAQVAIGLPWLETMGWGDSKSNTEKAPVRMAFLTMPNGVNPNEWTPEGEGADFKLSRILSPLESLKKEILVLTHLQHRNNHYTPRVTGHEGSMGSLLAGTGVFKSKGSNIACGVSVDQMAAKKRGSLTFLPSIELSIDEENTGVSVCQGVTRLYGSHISWSSSTTPVAREIYPRLAFDRLFGKRNDSKDIHSILDLTLGEIKGLHQKVSSHDRHKLNEYLSSIRSLEKSIQFAEKNVKPVPSELIEGKQPAPGKPSDHDLHVTQMIDIITLAFQADRTRVASFMMGNASNGTNYAFLGGEKGGFHDFSHHANIKNKLEQYSKINEYHIKKYAELLAKLSQIKEGENSLLDNSMILFASNMRDGNGHKEENLPIVLAGRAGGQLSTGRHIVYPKDSRLCDLYLSMLNRFGVKLDQYNDSSGELPHLSV